MKRRRREAFTHKGDHATRTRLFVVAYRGVTERRASRLVAPYSPKCVELDFSQLRVKGIDTLLTVVREKR
jgi:hypothetical protein